MPMANNLHYSGDCCNPFGLKIRHLEISNFAADTIRTTTHVPGSKRLSKISKQLLDTLKSLGRDSSRNAGNSQQQQQQNLR